jgi:hypothetical protein
VEIDLEIYIYLYPGQRHLGSSPAHPSPPPSTAASRAGRPTRAQADGRQRGRGLLHLLVRAKNPGSPRCGVGSTGLVQISQKVSAPVHIHHDSGVRSGVRIGVRMYVVTCNNMVRKGWAPPRLILKIKIIKLLTPPPPPPPPPPPLCLLSGHTYIRMLVGQTHVPNNIHADAPLPPPGTVPM